MRGFEVVGIVIVVLSASVAAAFALTTSLPASPCSGIQGEVRVFSVIADVNGYNGSKAQNGNGPMMQVLKCDVVVINLTNTDAQAHGLSVEFYAANGVESLGRQTVTLRFLASKTGQFRVYCNTVCSVHPLMQHGQLTVT